MVLTQAVSSPARFIVAVTVFHHPGLVADALRSLLEQQGAQGLHIIVVDDGCSYQETRALLQAFAAANPGIVTCVRQDNRGLSGARNAAIEIALRDHAAAEAIHFLDSDNRLEPWAVARAQQALKTCPEADFLFPDLIGFGREVYRDLAGAFSLFELLEHNYCDAGSVVRMRVFQAGLRFDETMRRGLEDWEFWLQAGAAGFRGLHLADAGFRYRRRGESMLAESDRDRETIVTYIRGKHRKHFTLQKMLRLEACERPRFAFVDASRNEVRYGLEWRRHAPTISLEEFAERISQRPQATPPPITIFAMPEILDALDTSRLLTWALWELEAQARANALGALSLGENTDDIRITGAGIGIEKAHLLAVRSSALPALLAKPLANFAEKEVSHIRLGLPRETSPSDVENCDAGSAWMHMHKAMAIEPESLPWRGAGADRVQQSRTDVYRAWHGISRPFPRTSERRAINVGFILPLASFGGVERVAHQMARAMRDMGYIPHLIIAGAPQCAPTEDEIYETIRFFRNDAMQDDMGDYYGTRMGGMGTAQASQFAGLCADLDVVINAHSDTANFAMGLLRRNGILTVSAQHVFDRDMFGRPMGHPFLGAAFEHAYDLVTAISGQMRDQLHALGVPLEKILVVPNAPGFSVTAAIARRPRAVDGLRCIYLGRLDRQKGIDRLEKIIRRCKAEGMPVSWRVVGAAIIDGAPRQEVAGVAVTPPVHAAQALADHMQWADILILPSRYEGLPLVVLEAMSLGCVVIASDVGAIGEVIETGRNGFLFDQQNMVDATVETLGHLLAEPHALDAIQSQALATMNGHGWKESLAPLDTWIGSRIGKRGAA